MKVQDIMQRSLVTVSEDTPVKEVSRLIFSLGLAGIPVVKDKKLIGIVTEKDILVKFHPSVREYMEDPVHTSDFEQMEKRLGEFLNVSAREIMSKNPTTITSDTPLVKAQSIMAINHISRLPIVDRDGNLIGIVSQGDIFRELVKNEMPRLEKERYAGFIVRHYDLMVNWKKRFSEEFPVLLSLFKKEKVKTVLDVGVWTGEYTIGLVKKGVNILGLDNHKIMIDMSEQKRQKLSKSLKKNISFMLTDYSDFSQKIESKLDVAICMGNSLPYIPVPLPILFRQISKSLRDKNAVVVLQILNFEKLLKLKNRLISFIIQKSADGAEKEHLFTEFFDKGKGNILIHHIILFDSDGKNWIYKGTTSIPIYDIRKENLKKILQRCGFKKITFSGNMGEYQGDYGKLSFNEPFRPLESDWLNIVARR